MLCKHKARCLTCPSSLSFSAPLEDLFLQLASALLILPIALDLQTCNSFQESIDGLSIVGGGHWRRASRSSSRCSNPQPEWLVKPRRLPATTRRAAKKVRSTKSIDNLNVLAGFADLEDPAFICWGRRLCIYGRQVKELESRLHYAPTRETSGNVVSTP